MNYLLQLQAFDTWQETNEISASAVALWFALMQTANRSGWKSPLNVAMSVLEHRSGLERRSLYRARNTLKQVGLIDFKERGANRSSEYFIKVLYEFDTQSVTQSVTQSDTHSVTHSVTQSVTIPKQNKTKQLEKKNIKKKSDTFEPPTLEEVEAFGNAIGKPEYAEAFFNHYQANGWKVGGRARMVDWKAAYHGWGIRAKQYEAQNAPKEKPDAWAELGRKIGVTI